MWAIYLFNGLNYSMILSIKAVFPGGAHYRTMIGRASDERPVVDFKNKIRFIFYTSCSCFRSNYIVKVTLCLTIKIDTHVNDLITIREIEPRTPSRGLSIWISELGHWL